MSRESIGHTFRIAVLLCGVCSLLVSGTAVALRPRQLANKALEKKRNVLVVAGEIQPGERVSRDEISSMFDQIDARLIDLETGEYVEEVDGILASEFDQRKAAKTEGLNLLIDAADDKARIKRRERYSFVYFVKNAGQLEQIILPVYGSGLWSTMYGFISLESDLKTIRGLVFYEHGETPGLGGEIDNPKWRSKWQDDKQLYDADGNLAIRVIKGAVTPNTANKENKVDGLSGATLTANGVSGLLQYWLGDNGFGAFLKRMQQEGAANG
jgi:Na+-transporting NADH:ubiquinone oxidoreductase subunit C